MLELQYPHYSSKQITLPLRLPPEHTLTFTQNSSFSSLSSSSFFCNQITNTQKNYNLILQQPKNFPNSKANQSGFLLHPFYNGKHTMSIPTYSHTKHLFIKAETKIKIKNKTEKKLNQNLFEHCVVCAFWTCSFFL